MKKYQHILNEHEGWNLFDIEAGEDKGEKQIQYIVGSNSPFTGDDDAIKFVLAKAAEGSKRHIATLRELRNSPHEKRRVRKIAEGIGLAIRFPEHEYDHRLEVWSI